MKMPQIFSSLLNCCLHFLCMDIGHYYFNTIVFVHSITGLERPIYLGNWSTITRYVVIAAPICKISRKKMCKQNLFSNSRQLIDKVIFLLFHCSFLPMLTFDGQYEKFHTLKTTHCPIWAAPKNDLTINECYENWKKILILSTISV